MNLFYIIMEENKKATYTIIKKNFNTKNKTNMLSLVNMLNVVFLFFIGYQLILAFYSPMVEGMVEGMEDTSQPYQPYDTNNPQNALILAQQNAGNISYLKEQLNKCNTLYQQVQDMSGNVQTLQTQVYGIVQAQQDYSTQINGGNTPEITGT
jgi:hypothetical protein